ncbi:Levansucrase [Lactobacillus helveticus]|nr:Levansucrase [Lactobacillus helveticus]
MKHQNIQSTEAKTVTETIHYQGAGHQTPADNTAQVTFTRPVSTDAVIGEKTYGTWSAAQNFAAVKSPELKGYTADKPQIDKQTVNGGSKDLKFTVTYTKNAPTITTEKKTVNETIHYVYKDGSKAVDDYVAKPVEFTRQVSTDAVTGEKTYGSWSAAQSFAAVKSPAIKGYTPDQAEIRTQTVTGDSSNLDFTVVYTANRSSTPVKPAKPVVPTKPAKPIIPIKPAKPVTPAKLNNLGQSTNPSKLVQNSNMASVRNKKQANENEMPQTGENNSQSQTMSFIGILLAMFGSLLGFLGIKKHRND